MRSGIGAVVALAVAQPALAWDLGGVTQVELPVDGQGVAVVEVDGAPWLLAPAPDQTAVRALPGGEVAPSLPASNAVLSHDLTGDGRAELLLCATDGLSLVRGGPEAWQVQPLAQVDCQHIAVASHEGVPAVLTLGPAGLQRWLPGKGGLVASPVDIPEGMDQLAAYGAEIWVAATGQAEVHRAGGETKSLDGPLVELFATDKGVGWIWGGQTPGSVGAGPQLEVALIATAAGEQRFALMPERKIGWVEDGKWRKAPLSQTAASLAVADVNGDGCQDVVTRGKERPGGAVLLAQCGGAASWTSVPGMAAAPKSERRERDAAPRRSEDIDLVTTLSLAENRWAQVQLPKDGSLVATLADEQGVPFDYVKVRGAPSAMSLSGSSTLNYEPRRSDTGLWRLSVVGRRRDGGRLRSGVLLDVVGTDEPMGYTESPTIENTAVVATTGQRKRTGKWAIRQCDFGTGLALGASYNPQTTWEAVGQPLVMPGMSPALSLLCGGGSEKLQWVIGADSAPSYAFRTEANVINHVLAVDFGVQRINDRTRLGVHALAGITVAGFAARAAWLPVTTKRGAVQGLEGRLTVYPASLGAQAMALWTWNFGRKVEVL